MSVQQRGRSWQASFMLDGQRYRETFTSSEEAVLWEAECRSAHKSGKPLPHVKSGGVQQGGGRIRNLQDLYDVTVRDNWSRRNSGKKLARNAEFFLEWYGANNTVKSVTSGTLYEFAEHLRVVKGNDDATINRKMSSVKVMLKVAERLGLIDRIPYVEKFQEKSAGSASDFFDFDEENAVIAQLDHRGLEQLSRLVIFMIDTGARINEALTVNYSTIQHNRVRFEHRKNGKYGVVPLTKRAQAVVERCRVVGTHPEKPFGDIKYRWALDNLSAVYKSLGGRYANISQPFHIFRHSCASRLAIRGVDANRIQEWMDHSNLSVTQRYMKLSPTALDGVVDALEPERPSLKVVKS